MQPTYLKTEPLNVNISLLYGIGQNFASICFGLALKIEDVYNILEKKITKELCVLCIINLMAGSSPI